MHQSLCAKLTKVSPVCEFCKSNTVRVLGKMHHHEHILPYDASHLDTKQGQEGSTGGIQPNTMQLKLSYFTFTAETIRLQSNGNKTH